MIRTCTRRPAEHGFALLIVLWTVAALALLMATLMAETRTEAKLAIYRRGAAVAEAAADAAIAETVLRLLRPGDPIPFRQRIGAVEVTVRLENLSGRVNPNLASPVMLSALMQNLGMESGAADHLAAAIVDWRTPGQSPSPRGAKAPEYLAAHLSYGPPGRPFEHLDELGAVLGMNPATLAAVTPHLTLWSTSDPNPAYAGEVVLRALRTTGVPPVATQSTEAQVIAITATASAADAPRVRRRGVIRFGYSPDGRAWRVLTWDDDPDP
jgi:general secretion pathway protein K